MSLVDKSQAIGNWDPPVDPNIPSWKRELIIKKRAALRTAGESKSCSSVGKAVGESDAASAASVVVGNDAGKSSSVREKWHGGNAHESAVHPIQATTSATGPSLLLHASGNKHKDRNCGAIHPPKVAWSSVDSGGVVSGQKQRSITRPTADKASSGWQSENDRGGGEFFGGRRFCGKHSHGRMVEEKGGGGGGGGGEFVVVGSKCAETTTSTDGGGGGGIASTSPTCSSFSDGFVYCSDSDGDEFEYGPGIVDRLRSKFINLTVNEMEKERYGLLKRQPMRRVASLENMLDKTTSTETSDDLKGDVTRARLTFGSGGGGGTGGDRIGGGLGLKANRKKLDVLKKARSMETLTPIDNSAGQKKVFYFERPKSNLLFNENVVIIEQQPKRSQSSDFSGPIFLKRDLVRRLGSASIEEDELPKPDIVRTYKKIFENSLTNDLQKKPAQAKSLLKTAKSDTSFSVKSISAKSRKDGAASVAKRTNSEVATFPTPMPWNNDRGKRENSVEHTESRTVCNGDVVAQEDPLGETLTKDPGDSQVKKSTETSTKIQEQMPVNITREPKEDLMTVKKENEPMPENVSAKNRPRIVDVKSKTDEKPVGLIKPLTVSAVPSEQKENFINQVKSAMAKTTPPKTILNGTIEGVPDIDPGMKSNLKKPQSTKQQDGNSIVFNFTGKSNIIPNISNTQSSFSVQRPLVKIDNNTGKLVSNLFRGGDVSGIVLIPGMTTSVSSDYSDEDDFVDGFSSEEPILPCGIQFEGENVIIGRSCLLQKRNKQLNIKFDDSSTSTYEYPSELLLIEEYSFSHDEEDEEEMESLKNVSIVTQADSSVDETKNVQNTKQSDNSSSLSNNTAVNSLGGLASYIPSKLSESETFELGVSRPVSFTPPSVVRTDVQQSDSRADEEEMMLKPAEDDQVSSWSSSQTSETDLLF